MTVIVGIIPARRIATPTGRNIAGGVAAELSAIVNHQVKQSGSSNRICVNCGDKVQICARYELPHWAIVKENRKTRNG